MVTKLGRDSFAEIATGTMKELGMDPSYVLYSEDTPTGVALITVDDGTGQNEIVVIPGALDSIPDEEVESFRKLIKDADYLLIQLEIDLKADLKAAQIAKEYGCKVILNSAPYAPVDDELVSLLYMVTPNEVEAGEITGYEVTDLESAKKAAGWFHERGVECVIITLGEKGVFLSQDGRQEILPAFKVDAIDTTGAGDAFSGGLLAGLCAGKSLEESVEYGQALAALSVQKLGTTPSMPWKEEIEAFLAKRA